MQKISLGRRLIIVFLGLLGAGLVLGFGNSKIVQALTEADVIATQNDSRVILTINSQSDVAFELQASYLGGIDPISCQATLNQTLINDGVSVNDAQIIISLPSIMTPTWYCFKIENTSTSEIIWKSYEVQSSAPLRDIIAPTINISRSRNDWLIISVNDVDLDSSSWRYGLFDFEPNCRQVALSRTPNAGQDPTFFHLQLTEEHNDHWYCFQVGDTSDNISYEAYAVNGVDTTPPTIVIEQNNRILTASVEAEEVKNWAYTYSEKEIICNGNTFLNNRSQVKGYQVTLTTDRINYYYCFRAADQIGNYGYQSERVQSVDFSAPQISLRQDGLNLAVSSNGNIEAWHYLNFDTNLACNNQTNFESAISFSTTSGLKLKEADHNHYICVRGVNATNTAGFTKLRIDTQAPRLSLKFDEESAQAIMTDADEIVAWASLKTATEIDCNTTNNHLFQQTSEDYRLGQKILLADSDNGDWLCFRAKDKAGHYGYVKQQISGITRFLQGVEGVNNSRGNLDIMIITILLVSGGGFVLYRLLAMKKKQATDLDTSTPMKTDKSKPASKRRQKSSRQSQDSASDLIQPLDYLKKKK